MKDNNEEKLFGEAKGLLFRWGFLLLYGFLFPIILQAGCTRTAHTEYIRKPFSKKNLDNKKTFTSLGKALEKPETVYSLSLRGEGMSAFPRSILTLKNLHTLVLNANYLKELSLSYSSIKEFPKKITQFHNLTYLDLSGNQLKTLSPEISKLQNLEYLGLSYNSLEHLPDEIGTLSRLEQLDLMNNKVKLPPSEFKVLKNLKKLNLFYNKFQEHEKEKIKKLLPNTEVKF